MIIHGKEVKNILFDLGVEGNEYGDLVEYISNLHAEIKRLRKDFKGLGKSLKQQLPHCRDKEMIEWTIGKIQEMIR